MGRLLGNLLLGLFFIGIFVLLFLLGAAVMAQEIPLPF